MNISYKTAQTSLRLQELPTVTATELKHSTADVLDQVSGGKAFTITRHEKPRAVLISIEQYKELTSKESTMLADLQMEYGSILDQMQSPEQKAAAIRAFNATPEEMGKAAVAVAMKTKKETTPQSHAG